MITRSNAIKQKALELGFDIAGITDASPIDAAHIEHLKRWLADGYGILPRRKLAEPAGVDGHSVRADLDRIEQVRPGVGCLCPEALIGCLVDQLNVGAGHDRTGRIRDGS